MKFNPGDFVYIIENSRNIRKAFVMKVAGDFCTIHLEDSDAAIRLRNSRLYVSEEEAKKAIRKTKPQQGAW